MKSSSVTFYAVTRRTGFSSHRIFSNSRRRRFGGGNIRPVLHVVRYKAGKLDALIDALDATGFGLTLAFIRASMPPRNTSRNGFPR